MNIILGLIAIVVLVGLNGFFVAAEFALVGARRTRLAQLAKDGHRGAMAAAEAIQHLDNYIAATQLGITLASLGLGWIGEPALSHFIEPLLISVLPHESAEAIAVPVSIGIGFTIVTILHIVMGELVPKSIALQRPEGTSVIVARPTALFLNIFRPVIWLMNGVGNRIVRLLGFHPVEGHAQVHSAEELEMLVHSSREAGLLQETEEQLLRRVFDFSDLQVRQIMKPRFAIDALPVETSFQDLLQHITTKQHTRYPIYENDIDHIVGILHIKDLFNLLLSNSKLLGEDSNQFNLESLLREPLFVPALLPLDQLLEQMQSTQTQFAIVLDEYGGIAGVATMEDVIEEIVGEVQDEFDNEQDPIVEQGDAVILDGLVSMSEALSRFGDEDIEHESATIGGYVGEKLNRIPTVGDRIQLGDYEIRVLSMVGLRVEQVQVIKSKAARTEESGEED